MKPSGQILVADDDVRFLSVTLKLLERAGYECDGVPSGPEAAQQLLLKDYDLLLTDLDMPGNKDLGLVRELPQLVVGLPVILMTGYPTLQTAIEAVQLSVTAYLLKPFDEAELLLQVSRAIERYKAYKAVRANHCQLEEWHQALAAIEGAMSSSRLGQPTPWQTLLDLTQRNIVQALKDLRSYTEMAASQNPTAAQPQELSAPAPLLLLEAMRETICILDKTKSSFRSKELGALRKKLESLLQAEPPRPKSA